MSYLYVYPCVSRMVIFVIQTISYLVKVLNHVDSEPVTFSHRYRFYTRDSYSRILKH